MTDFVISAHAIDRYRSRVHPVSVDSARDALRDLLSDARIRPTPRHWMRSETRYGSGVRFAYSPRAPHVALVLRGSKVTTVLTRSLYGNSRLLADAPERQYDRKQRGRRVRKLSQHHQNRLVCREDRLYEPYGQRARAHPGRAGDLRPALGVAG